MSIFYYDKEKELEMIRKDEYELGYEAGYEAGRREGRIIGLVEEGRRQGIVWAIKILLADWGDIPEYVYDRIFRETDRDQLERWLKLAAKMDSKEEFLKELKVEQDDL